MKKIIAVKETRTCGDCCFYGKCGPNSGLRYQEIEGKAYHCNEGYVYKEVEETSTLDFSGISTDNLRQAVDGYSNDKGSCYGISCSDNRCPFGSLICCETSDISHKAFKAELEKREKDMNTMPELKIGQIVLDTQKSIKMVMPDNDKGNLVLISRTGDYSEGNLRRGCIEKIYELREGINYVPFFKEQDLDSGNFRLIWSKPSPNDIKIQEIGNTINTLESEHKESVLKLRNKIEEFKG